MAISLNGSSQYVSLANGSQPVRLRPFAIAALVNRTSGGSYTGIFACGGYGTSGFSLEFDSGSPYGAYWLVNSPGVSETNFAGFTLTPTDGWCLIVACAVDSGANSTLHYWKYRYATSTMSYGSGTYGDVDATTLAAGASSVVGAWLDGAGSTNDHFPGQIGWVGLWDKDIGVAEGANNKFVAELATRGPWGMLDSNCKFFMPFANAARDLSGGGYHGTLQGSPSYVGSGPAGELPPTSAWYVQAIRAAGGTPVDLDATGTAQSTGTASLEVTRNLTATGTGQSSGTAALEVTRNMAATGTGQSSGTASLEVTRALSATGTGQSTGSASLEVTRALATTGTAQSSGSGTIEVTRALQATATVQSSGSAALEVSRELTATGQGQSTGAGSLEVIRLLAATGVAQSTGVGDLQVGGQVDLSATGAATSSGSASLEVTRLLSATGTATSAASASLEVTRNLAAYGQSQSAASGSLEVTRLLEAIAASASAAQAQIEVTRALGAIGQAQSSGSGALEVSRLLAAIGQAISTGIGVLEAGQIGPPPVGTIREVARPTATIAQVARPVGVVVTEVSVPTGTIRELKPVATIALVAKPGATIRELD